MSAFIAQAEGRHLKLRLVLMCIFSILMFEDNVVLLLFYFLGLAGLNQEAGVKAACGEGGSCWWSIFAGLYGRKKELNPGRAWKSMNNISAVMQFSLVEQPTEEKRSNMPGDASEKLCPWACSLARVADPSCALGELLSEVGSRGEGVGLQKSVL